VARLPLLQQQLPQVVVLLRRTRRDAASVVPVSAVLLLAAPGAALDAALLHLGGRRGARGRDEEVDAAALELGVGRHDGDLPGAARAPRCGERVVGVRGEDGGGGERAGELVDVPAEVHDADDVQRAAGEHAREAAAQAVPHGSCVEASWNTPPAALFARACFHFELSSALL
jgi:hypothetical protein